jgi:hypothetical protein
MEQQPTAVEYFALLTVLALSCVGGFMGFRIFRNAMGGGGTSEKWVGLSLLLVCLGGYVPVVIAQLVGSPEVRFLFVALGIGAAHAGVLCIFVFTRRVFRPDVPWLRVAVWIMVALMAAVWLSGLVYVNWPLRAAPREAIVAGFPWAIASNVLCGVGMAWSAAEAIRQWSLSRKRARVGLADPLVANRMLLWGVFTGASFLTCLMHGTMAANGVDPGDSGAAIALSGVLALASTVALWLAFLPPQAWIRRIRGGASAA